MVRLDLFAPYLLSSSKLLASLEIFASQWKEKTKVILEKFKLLPMKGPIAHGMLSINSIIDNGRVLPGAQETAAHLNL